MHVWVGGTCCGQGRDVAILYQRLTFRPILTASTFTLEPNRCIYASVAPRPESSKRPRPDHWFGIHWFGIEKSETLIGNRDTVFDFDDPSCISATFGCRGGGTRSCQGRPCKIDPARPSLQGRPCKVVSARPTLQGDLCKVVSARSTLQGHRAQLSRRPCKAVSARPTLHGRLWSSLHGRRLCVYAFFALKHWKTILYFRLLSRDDRRKTVMS